MPKKYILALMLFAGFLTSFQPKYVRGQEPAVEVVTQNETVSTEETGTALPLPSRFPFRLSLSILGGYDDNVGTTGERQGSPFANGRGTLSYDLSNVATRLTVRAGAGIVYFPDRTNGRTYDVNTNLNLSLNQKVSVRLTLSASVAASYQVEPDFSSDAGPSSRRGQYLNMVDTLSAAYQWFLRFSTVTSYTFRPVRYDDATIGAFENRLEHTFGEEFRFTLVPGTTLTGEYRFQIIDYDSAPRDSTTQFALAGLDHSFSSRLNVVARGGASFRSYTDDGNQTSPYAEGSVNFALAPDASLNLTTRYGIEESDSLGGGLSRTTFRTGLQLRYSLTRRISSTVAAYYHHDENQALNSPGTVGSGFSQDAFDGSLNVTYAINRYFGLNLGFQHSEVASGQSSRDYSRNRYSAGLNFTY